MAAASPALNFRLYQYKRPYQQAIQLKQGRFVYREGLILCVINKQGAEQLAEVAPFPGLQAENIADCIQQLYRLRQGSQEALFPSVAWGLHQLQQPLHPPAFADPLPINTLISGLDSKAFQTCVHERYQQGYRCFKIKVGLKALSEEVERVRHVLNLYPDITLRLDANRSWKQQDFQCFIENIDLSRVEYFEEPFRELTEYAKLKTEDWQYIALDESLAHASKAFLLQASAFVIKPMVLGPARLTQLLKWAQHGHKKIVFSACFETSVGLGHLAKYAAHYAPTTPCGLDTHQSFKTDIWTPQIQINQGQLDFDQAFFTAQSNNPLTWNTTYIRKID